MIIIIVLSSKVYQIVYLHYSWEISSSLQHKYYYFTVCVVYCSTLYTIHFHVISCILKYVKKIAVDSSQRCHALLAWDISGKQNILGACNNFSLECTLLPFSGDIMQSCGMHKVKRGRIFFWRNLGAFEKEKGGDKMFRENLLKRILRQIDLEISIVNSFKVRLETKEFKESHFFVFLYEKIVFC